MTINLSKLLAGQSDLAGGAAAAADQNLLLVDASRAAGPAVKRTYLVFLREATEPGAVGAAAALLVKQVAPGSAPRQLFEQLAGFAVDLTDAQAERLRQQPEVGNLELDRPMRLDPPLHPDPAKNDVFLPQALVSYANTPGSSGETVPWGVLAIWQGRNISSTGNSGAGTYAFVIDSGVLATTGDLNLNTTWSRSWIAGQDAFTDDTGHGTHVAGTIAALVNGTGVVGVAPGAEIVSLKVLDSTGSGTSLNVIDSINYAVSIIKDNNLDLSKVVINLSLGGPLDSALNAAMLNAADLGIRFAVAAGNSGVDADTASPATTGTHANIYTVSAVDSTYKMASWSNWDQVTASDPIDSVDYAAPGVNVISYYKNGALAYLSGTSMASPHMAGALLMGAATAGDLVTPYRSGTADPFVWASSFPWAAMGGISATLTGPAAIDEGQALSISIASSGAAASSSLYWSLSGVGITSADVSDSALSGESVVQADGTASINLSVSADLVTEGNELLAVQLYGDAAHTLLLANTTVRLNDTSRAPLGDQVLWGTTASDTLVGAAGNDRITGVLATGTTTKALGKGQIDVLTGDSGADTFLLGDSRGVFYNDGVNGNIGANDYARILDFSSGTDKLQLRNGNYFTTVSNGVTSIYWDRNANNILNTTGTNRDELIAMVTGTVASTDYVWV